MKRIAIALALLIPCLAATLGDVDKAKTLGNPSAPVRIELFSDFQCPGCKAFHERVLPVLMRDYVVPGKAYIFNHEFPLQAHQYSREAAYLATAAASVGKYSQVSDVLFQQQASWSTSGKVWDAVASVLTPAERPKVQALAKDPATIALVQKDLDTGKSRINQTPTVIVSRGAKTYSFPGPDPSNYPLLRSLIDGLLK